MNYEFSVQVTEEHVLTALRRFLWRNVGLGSICAVVFCSLLVFLDWNAGALSKLSMFVLSVVFLFLGIIVCGWFYRKRESLALLELLEGEPVTYRIHDEGVEAGSKMGQSSIHWKLIRELWIDTDVILLFYGRGAYSTIPADQVPSEALIALQDRVRAEGGKVVSAR